VASDPNFKIIALRYFNPVGAHNSGLIGESPKGIPNNLLPYIADVAFGKLPNLSVFGCDYQTLDGTGIRDYIHVMDIAEGHLAALKFISKNKGWNVFNLGTGEGKSVLEVIQAYSQINNVQVPYSIVERRPGDVASIYASAANANHKLNWKAKRNLNEMCKSSWIWRVNLEKVKHD
jgi:UDP-glucose 4-epimerase